MQKFFLFFVKKLLTKFLSHSIISNVSGTRQNTKQYARVAQLVEHDLAKVGVASSSLVYRSFENQVVILKKTAWSFIFQAPFSMVLSIIGRNLNWTYCRITLIE